jgi:hypothetical protein
MVLLGSITDLVGSGTTPADLPRADFGESRPVDVFEPLKVALLIGSTTEPYNMFHNIYIMVKFSIYLPLFIGEYRDLYIYIHMVLNNQKWRALT